MNKTLQDRLENLSRIWCGKLDVQFQVLNAETVSSKLVSNATYRLSTSTSTQQASGSHAHDCSSKSDCWSKIDYYCNETKAGGNAQANLSIIKMIQADPIKTLSTTEHIESIEHAYVEACGTCSGSGKNRCNSCSGSGRSSCHQCTGGRRTCTSCGGGGRMLNTATSQYTSCSGCGGSGGSTCGYCMGSGQVSCATCSGSGDVSCNSCAGTGYFTYTVTAQTYLSSKQFCQCEDTQQNSWLDEYIERALKNEVPQAYLNETVDWDLDTFRLDTDDGLPYSSVMHGLLESTEAKISLNTGNNADCRLIGSEMKPYNMDALFDSLIKTNVDSLKENYSHEKAQQLFNTKLATSSFDELNTTSLPDDLISWANLISNSVCNSMKQSLLHVGHMFDKMRSQIRLIDLLLWTLVFVICGMLTVNLLTGLSASPIPWDQIGLRSFLAAIPLSVEWFLTESTRGIESQLIPYMLITFIPAMLCLFLFGTRQTWSFRRMMIWYWGFSLFIGLFLLSFKPAFDSIDTVMRVFSIDAFRFHQGIEWPILIDVFLLASLFALLQARRSSFNIIRDEAAKVKSHTLNVLLKYETRD